MITIKCKCGTSEMTFHSLSEKDFPNGWETDCCLEKTKSEPKKQPEVTEDLVEAQLEVVEELEAGATPEEETASEGAPTSEEEQPKRRGRKPKA